MGESLILIIGAAFAIILLAMVVYAVRFLTNVPKEMKRIADAIETQNAILQNKNY